MTPERDGATGKTLAVASAAAVLAATTAGPLIDMRGYRRGTLTLHVGVGGITFTGANKIDFVLQAGNAADGSDLANVTADDVIVDGFAPTTITGGIVRSLQAVHAAADIQKVGYIGGKRYAKLTPTFSGTHGTGTPIAAEMVLDDAEVRGAV